MSMISEQVKELRKLSEGYIAGGHRHVGDKLKQAADTIVALSARLEESKWIPCSDRLPEEPEVSTYDTIRTLIREGLIQEYIVMLYGATKPTTLWYTGDGVWYDPYTEQTYLVTAWHPLPEPYKPNNRVAVEKNRKTKPKMNEDIEEFLIEKKRLYQKRITRLQKQGHDIHGLLECEPGREDVIEDLNTVIKLQDRYNALIEFITELQESYF